MEPDSALESEDDNTPIEERDSFLPVDQFTEAMGRQATHSLEDLLCLPLAEDGIRRGIYCNFAASASQPNTLYNAYVKRISIYNLIAEKSEALIFLQRAKVSDDDGKDEEYNDTKRTSEDEYENPDMSSDSEELDEGDIEFINAENVRVIMKNAGPSAEEVTHNVRNDTKYHLLKADRTYKKSFHYRQLCRQDVEVNFRNSL
ncbi:hypothetical protein DTO282F9_7781 [Paecilomyces variotii]|nr:hypothetical protein DTO282F9_7781 [Paecilomyces variotii]